MAKKHFIKMKEFAESVEREKLFINSVEKLGYVMRKSAEATAEAAGLTDCTFVMTPGADASLAEAVSEAAEPLDDDDSTSRFMGLTFEADRNDEHIIINTYFMVSHVFDSAVVQSAAVRITDSRVLLYDNEWIDITDTEYGQEVFRFYSLTDGEKEFYSLAAIDSNDPEEGEAYLKASGELPALYDVLNPHTDVYAAEAEIGDTGEDEDTVPALCIPEKLEAVLTSSSGHGFDIFKYDEENSVPDYVTGLIYVRNFKTADEVLKYVTGAYIN